MGKKLIDFIDISKSYNGNTVLDELNLYVRENEFLTLLGPSGCGKTTTLRLLGGFETPDKGKIMFDSKDITNIPANERNLNTVFQKYALFPHLNVFNNIAFGLKLKKLPAVVIEKKVKQALKMVGMTDYEYRDVDSLSGGQQQRVAIARAIVNEPEVLLLDEPLAALDLKMRKDMQMELKEMHKSLGITFIYVTHDQEEAMTMAGRIAIMNRGKFVQIGEPEEIYEHPTTRYSAEFIGSVNVFEGVLKERQEDGLVLDSPGLVHPLKVDADASVVDNVPVHVALRPEKIMLCEEPPANGCNFAVGEVIHIAYLGDLSVYHVRLKSGQMISAQLQNAHRHRKGLPTWGDEVRLCWEVDSCVVLTV